MKTRLLWTAGVALTIATTAFGCTHSDTTNIVLPASFHGHVVINCLGTSSGKHSVAVDDHGNGDTPDCPKDEAHIVVVRDGAVIKPQGIISMQKTGDGIPVAFAFDIK